MNYKTLSLYTIHEIESIQLCAIESVKKNWQSTKIGSHILKQYHLYQCDFMWSLDFHFHLNNFWHLNIEITWPLSASNKVDI